MSDVVVKLVEKLGAEKVLQGADVKERHYHIWHMGEGLHAKAVTLPTSTEDVSTICRICTEHNQPIIVFGGLTNLVGSTETTGEEVIVSMERLNKIQEIDEVSRTMTVESGVILQHIQEAAKEKDLLFPLNFGAKGSAQIGGCISTNAGGLRVLKFGMTRALVLGVEAVLMDGRIISSMKKIIKDNSAYDLKQLFIGSEGTLGVITRAVLKLVEAPKSRNSAFLAFNDYEKLVSFMKFIDRGLAGALSGFEVIWRASYEVMTGPSAHNRPPIPHGYKYYVLVESLGADQEVDKLNLQGLIEQTILNGLAEDAVMADTESDLNWFWNIREDVKVLAEQGNVDQHFDVSAPINEMGSYVDQVEVQINELEGVHAAYPFGHLADGNIHFIVMKDHAEEPLKNRINDLVYNPLTELNGSVSAEHGIGLHKKKYLALCRSAEEIALMKTLKIAFDPAGLLNPGKVVDV